MNTETQEYINNQFDKRLTTLESKVENIDKIVNDIRVDQKVLIKEVSKSNDRWNEFDQTQRKNKNQLIMQGLGVVITVIITYALVQLGLSKQKEGLF